MRNDSNTIQWDMLPIDASKEKIKSLLDVLHQVYLENDAMRFQVCVWRTIAKVTDFSLERQAFQKFLTMLKVEPDKVPDKNIYWAKS